MPAPEPNLHAAARAAAEGMHQRPSMALLASEPARAAADLAAFQTARPILRRLPHGDGHPVLVLPGFTAGDGSTRPLRRLLRELGYHTHGWRLGVNVGPTDRILDGMTARLGTLAEQHPGQQISLIGWSLGGIYAREIARAAPEVVRQVITLGSPFRLTDRDESNAGPLYDVLSSFHSTRADSRAAVPEHLRDPLPVPSTAIYTRYDGVVPWRSSRDIDDLPGRHESIEVAASHCGLGTHPGTAVAIADRLAQASGTWEPFRVPRRFRLWFPPQRGARKGGGRADLAAERTAAAATA